MKSILAFLLLLGALTAGYVSLSAVKAHADIDYGSLLNNATDSANNILSSGGTSSASESKLKSVIKNIITVITILLVGLTVISVMVNAWKMSHGDPNAVRALMLSLVAALIISAAGWIVQYLIDIAK